MNNNTHEEFDMGEELLQALTWFLDNFNNMIASLDVEILRPLLLDTLQNVLDAVSLDAVNFLHLSSGLISIVFGENLEHMMKDVNESNGNPIKDSNLVILAARNKKHKSLSYMTTGFGRVLLRLGQNNGGKDAKPDDVDRENHTAYYYAMKSDDLSSIKVISEEMWGEMSSSELDDILSRTYSELKLKNISLRPEIEDYVIGKLVDLRFFSTKQIPTKKSSNPVEKIVQRIYFLLNAIVTLREYIDDNDEDTDLELIAVGGYVTKSLHVLKYQLRSTYDRIPWEEMEFCMVHFLKKYKMPLETHMYYCLVLTANEMSKYLGLFSEVLESLVKHVLESSVRDLAKYPKKERSAIVAEIENQHELFKRLRIDYERVRDFHSLELMKIQADLVSEADWDSGGLTVVTRALQVIGENLKKSIETPKLSTAEYLLRHFQVESRKVLEKLRDSLSKDKFMMLREQIASYGEPFFRMLKGDICELNKKIASCLLWKKEEICKELVSKILQCSSSEEIRNLFKCINIYLGLIIKEEKEEERVRKIFQESLRSQLELLNEIGGFVCGLRQESVQNLLLLVKNKMKRATEHLDIYYYQLACIYNIALGVETNLMNEYIVKQEQSRLEFFQKCLSETFTESYFEYTEVTRSELISSFKRMEPNLTLQVFSTMSNVSNTILHKMNENNSKVRWIKELKTTLDANKTSKGLENSDLETLQKSKLDALQKLFDEHNLFKSPKPYENDSITRAQVDMLVLDLMSLLSDSHFSHNPFFLDHLVPVAIGKNLRNHLAHGNVLYDVLLARQSVHVLSSARKILEMNEPPLHKLDQVVPCDVHKLRDDFEREMKMIKAQRGLFRAARSGDVDAIAAALSEGADVDGRNTRRHTPLHLTAFSGHYEACRFLCERGANPLCYDIEGKTPLHLAAGSGSREVIAYLVAECRVHVDIRDSEGRSPLFAAAEAGKTGAIEDLLELGAKADLRCRLQTLPVCVAVAKGHVEALKVLLDHDSELVFADVGGGCTLQHVIAANGSVDMFHLLQSRDGRVPDIDARDELSLTPLIHAASSGNCELIRYLVENGANVNATGLFCMTPLISAVHKQRCEAVETLLSLGADPDLEPPRLRFRDFGYPEIEKCILDESILDKSIQPSRDFALIGAARCLRCTEALLRKGANVDAQCRSGDTALHYAVYRKHEGVARTLISHGASTVLRNDEGRTPLHNAAFFGLENICEILLGAHDADVNAVDSRNMSPVDYAMATKRTEIAKMLKLAGANTSDRKKLTAFLELTMSFPVLVPETICAKLDRNFAVHYGVKRGNIQFLKFCLQNNFAVNVKDHNGDSPLHRAVQLGNSEMVEILLENEASVDLRDGTQKTALDVAVMNSNPECADFLIRKGSKIRFETMCLAVRNDSEVLGTLLKEGFDVNSMEGGRTLLHEAAAEGSANAVETLLEAGADIEMGTEKNFERALHLAASHGHRDVVVALLSKKVDPNPLTLDQSTPLHVAITGGHANVVLALLQGGADIHIDHPVNGTVFEQAARTNNLPALRILRDHINETGAGNSSLGETEDFLPFDESPAHRYSIKNKSKKTTKFPEKQISPAVKDHVGLPEHLPQTPRKKKCSSKERVISERQTLVTHPERVSGGPPVNSLRRKSKRNLRTKKLSKKRNRRELMKYTHSSLEETTGPLGDNKLVRSTKHTPTVQLPSISTGPLGDNKLVRSTKHTPAVQLPSISDQRMDNNCIEQNDSDLDGLKSDVHGFLLHIAAERGFLEMARYLVTEGMDVWDLNSDGLQPLHLACRNGHSDVVSLLLQEMKGSRRRIPKGLLHFASEGGHCDVLELLFKVGVSINDMDSNGDTAVHLAARGGHELALRKLILHGAFFDVKNSKFKTPLDEADSKAALVLRPIHRLFNAVKNDHIGFIERNLEEGAFVNARCCTSRTPLVLASERGSIKAVDLLLTRGANPNSSGPKGNVPLHFASCRTGGDPIVRSLLQHDAIYEARSEDGKTPLQVAKNPSDCLLRMVDKIFRWLQKGKGFETRVLLALLSVTDFQDRKAVVRARDRNGRNLMMVATRIGFGKMNALKLAVTGYFVMVDILKVALLFKDSRKSILNVSEALLEKMQELLCPDDPIVQEIHSVVAISHLLMGDMAEGFNTQTSVVESLKRTVGSKSPRELFSGQFLSSNWPEAVFETVKGKFRWCEFNSDLYDCVQFFACIKNACETSGKGFPVDSGERDLLDAYMFRMIGMVLKNPHGALKRLSQSYDIFKKILGDDNQETMRSLYLLAEYLSTVGDFDRARLCFEKLLTHHKKTLGVYDPHTTIIQLRLGTTLFQLGKTVGALLILKEVLNRESENIRMIDEVSFAVENIQNVLTNVRGVPECMWQDLDAVFSKSDQP